MSKNKYLNEIVVAAAQFDVKIFDKKYNMLYLQIMKTLTQYVDEKAADKVWAVYDRNDIFINYFYTSDDAESAADEMNNDTPSLKFHVKEMNRSEIEN